MKTTNNVSVIGRRQLLAGFGALTLTACTGTTSATLSTRTVTEPDPLAQFRLFADAGADVWSRHLPPPRSDSGPCVLALSGGGEDGAFGAGALTGWSASGDRPAFDIVTGVSTGALIAPFAFLGSIRDDDLRQIFTEHDASDIMRMKPLQALFGDALYDTTPLAQLITDFTPPAVIAAVADRHANGARLFIVTSELESARAYVWNMGEIARAGQYDLFRAVMRASAALPGLFPPVKLEYAVGNTTYAETHIDGGVHMQVLAVPEFTRTSTAVPVSGGALYLLINNTLDPAPNTVSRSALAISQQALMTSSRASAAAAVNAAKMFTRASDIALSVASINANSGINYDPSDRFSSIYMKGLYRHGFERGAGHALWTQI